MHIHESLFNNVCLCVHCACLYLFVYTTYENGEFSPYSCEPVCVSRVYVGRGQLGPVVMS